jgi:hypothetical protein
MPNKVNAYNIPVENLPEIGEIIRKGDGFKVLGKADFPRFLPKSFTEKCDSATQIVSGSAGNTPIVMFNFHRVDGYNIDEHPYGVMMLSGSVAISGSFLDHGDWSNRTTPVTKEHAQMINMSGIGDYYLNNPKYGVNSGSFHELSENEYNAFKTFVDAVFDPSDFK